MMIIILFKYYPLRIISLLLEPAPYRGERGLSTRMILGAMLSGA